jgi:hypothetical protein
MARSVCGGANDALPDPGGKHFKQLPTWDEVVSESVRLYLAEPEVVRSSPGIKRWAETPEELAVARSRHRELMKGAGSVGGTAGSLPPRPQAGGWVAGTPSLSSSDTPPGNTGIESIQGPVTGRAGVDGLSASVWGTENANFRAASHDIAVIKALLQTGHRTLPCRIGGEIFYPERQGLSRGPRFAHVAIRDGIKYFLHAEWPDSRIRSHVAFCEISALKLARVGPWAAWNEAAATFRLLGIVVTDSCVSRIDMRCDVAGAPLPTFAGFFAERRYVSRFKKGHTFIPWDPAEVETIYIGTRGYLLLRIYRKILQLQQLPAAEGHAKYELLLEEWDGNVDPDLVRIEWEIPRVYLKQFEGVRSVESVLQHLPAIIDRLNTDTIRLTTEVNKRDHHQSELITDPMWEQLNTVFADALRWPAPRLDRASPRPADLAVVIEQFMHRGTSIAAVRREPINSASDLVRVLTDELRKVINETHVEKVAEKRAKLSASGAATVLGVKQFVQPKGI